MYWGTPSWNRNDFCGLMKCQIGSSKNWRWQSKTWFCPTTFRLSCTVENQGWPLLQIWDRGRWPIVRKWSRASCWKSFRITHQHGDTNRSLSLWICQKIVSKPRSNMKELQRLLRFLGRSLWRCSCMIASCIWRQNESVQSSGTATDREPDAPGLATSTECLPFRFRSPLRSGWDYGRLYWFACNWVDIGMFCPRVR